MTETEPDRIEPAEMESLFDMYIDTAVKNLGVTGAVKTTDRYDSEKEELVRGQFSHGERIRELPLSETYKHKEGGHGPIAETRGLFDVRTDNHGDGLAAESEYVTERATHIGFNTGRFTHLQIGWKMIPTPREIRIAERLLDAEYDNDSFQQPTSVANAILREIFGSRPISRDEDDLWRSFENSRTSDTRVIRSGLTAFPIHTELDGRPSFIPLTGQRVDRQGLKSIWTVRGYGGAYVTVERWEDEDTSWGRKTCAKISTQGGEIYEIDTDGEATGALKGVVEKDGEEIEIEVECIGIPELPDPADVIDRCKQDKGPIPVTDEADKILEE